MGLQYGFTSLFFLLVGFGLVMLIRWQQAFPAQVFLGVVPLLVLFVGWSIFFIYVLMRFRSGAHHKADYGGVRGRWSTWIEGGVLVAEVILLAFFSIPFWTRNVDAAPPPENEATVVRVVAEQFAWHVHYPGADGVFGRTDITLVGPDNPLGLDRNETVERDDLVVNGRLNLPIGKPVIVFLSSKDVIHSFALPQMRIKQDAIPGIVQPVWFTQTSTGEWDIACSQLCGLGHYRMKGVYQIQSPEEYAAWLKGRGVVHLDAVSRPPQRVAVTFTPLQHP